MTAWTPAAQIAWAGSTGIPELDGAFLAFLSHKSAWDAAFDPATVEAADVISRVEEPVLFTPPRLISTRSGGKFISGQPRRVRLANPYVQGRIQLAPSSPEAGIALQQAQDASPNIWLISGMAVPHASATERVWPYRSDNPLARARLSAIFLSDLTISAWAELQGAQSVSGAITSTINYVGRINAGNRP